MTYPKTAGYSYRLLFYRLSLVRQILLDHIWKLIAHHFKHSKPFSAILGYFIQTARYIIIRECCLLI